MSGGATDSGWLISGFQAIVALWAWGALLVLHVVFRLWSRPEADPLRPSGPIEGGAPDAPDPA